MVLLSEVVDRHQGELERLHGHQLLPSHRQALQAMRRCRRQGGDLMVLHCSSCSHRLKVPHSCGHRSCPHCQHHDSQRWIERQQARLLPVEYFGTSEKGIHRLDPNTANERRDVFPGAWL
jgi:hypothetical protein